MYIIKGILLIVLAIALSFGVWYLLGWFVSGESDIMLWPWWGKVIYLILGFSGLGQVISELEDL